MVLYGMACNHHRTDEVIGYMKIFKWLIIVLVGLWACLFLLVALFYAEEDWRGRHDWYSFKQKWEAKGEHFNFTSFIPPPVPNGQNFALTPIVAGSYERRLSINGKQLAQPDNNVVDQLAMMIYGAEQLAKRPRLPDEGDWAKAQKVDLRVWQKYYRELATHTNEFPVPPQPQSPASDVLLALSKYNPAIEKLRQASRLPFSRFPLDYASRMPETILIPQLRDLKNCDEVLELRALAELQNDQSGKALADVKLTLSLANSIRREPFLICQLVRMVMLNTSLQSIWEGLAEHKWREDQLATLDTRLAKLDFLADYKQTMRAECVMPITTLESWRQRWGFNFFARVRLVKTMMGSVAVVKGGSSWGNYVGYGLIALVPSGWFYQNELSIAQIEEQRLLPAVNVQRQLVSPTTVRRYDRFMNSLNVTPQNVFARLLLPAMATIPMRFAYAQESVDLARVAIALERYRLAYGKYPAALDALKPPFMENIPHDINGGQPLHYRLTTNGQFVLYSVGWNESANHGVVDLHKDGRVDISKSDWVWRYSN